MTAGLPRHARGRFITVEGIEGAGKSTNIEFIAGLIGAAGYRVVVTREPGGTPLGERIRGLLLEPGQSVPPMAELLLMFAARAAHMAQVILPALAEGAWVVSDRFTDATFAYQGAGRGLPAEAIGRLEMLVQEDLHPDLTLLLDLPVTASADRQQDRSHRDRFERESAAFFSRVRQGYLDRAAAEPRRIRVIDADRELARVQADVRSVVDGLLATVAGG